MGQPRDDGSVYSVIDRAARLALALAVLGLALSGVAAANETTPAPATPAPAADDPGPTEPVDATAGMAIPAATGPVAGAGITAGIAIGVGLFSRFGRER